MTQRPPFNISEPEWDRGLWWMVAASGGLHLLAVALLLLMPHSFLHHPPALQSYTVDLVAPDQLGGSNIIEGGKGRVQGAPLAAAPPAPKVEPPPPPPKAEEAKPPEPPPPQAEKVAPKEVAQKPEPPKVEEKPKENEVALAVKKVAPPPAPSPQAKPAPSPKVVAKVEAAKPQAKALPKVDAQAAREAAAARARDERIEAAVRHIQQQTGARGGGTGQKAGEPPGGPISVGPGEGAGGVVMGVEYVLYKNQLENRIKQNWAWAGSNQALEAVIHFSITATGDVVDVRIVRPSGDPSYDASIDRAVRAISPLQPPPEQYRKQFSDVEYVFSPKSLQM